MLNTKNKIHDKINSITDFHAIWEHDPESKACRLVIEGIYMEKGKKQSGLTNLINYYEQGMINIFEQSNNENLKENKTQLAINLINKKMKKKVAFSLKEYQENKTLKAQQSKYIK